MINSLGISEKVVLAPYSWWKIGGVADYFVEPKSREHLLAVIQHLRAVGIKSCVVGQGTNVLFADEGFRGCVIRIGGNLSSVRIDGNLIEVEAGCWVPKLARAAATHGLSGLEHTIGIPASLGGLVCMNGGSQRKNIGSLIQSVDVLATGGEIITYDQADCGFAYRCSRFQDSGEIVLGALLQFTEQRSYGEQRSEMLHILRERNRKFPRKMPSCGSVFKSSPELFQSYGPPGKVIEDIGFKGRRIGNVQVSPVHANFIVNLGKGVAVDILAIVSEIHSDVLDRTGVKLEPEFLYLHPEIGLIPPLSCKQ